MSTAQQGMACAPEGAGDGQAMSARDLGLGPVLRWSVSAVIVRAPFRDSGVRGREEDWLCAQNVAGRPLTVASSCNLPRRRARGGSGLPHLAPVSGSCHRRAMWRFPQLSAELTAFPPKIQHRHRRRQLVREGPGWAAAHPDTDEAPLEHGWAAWEGAMGALSWLHPRTVP